MVPSGQKELYPSMYFRFCLYLLGALAVAILAAGAVTYMNMTEDARNAAEKQLSSRLSAVHEQFEDANRKIRVLTILNNNSMLASTRNIADIIKFSPQVLDDQDTLQRLCNESLAEALIVCDEHGIVRASTPEPLQGQALGDEYCDLLECAQGEHFERTSLMDTAGRTIRFSAVRRRDAPGVVILSYYFEHEQNARERGDLANLITNFEMEGDGYIIAFHEGMQVSQSVLPAPEAELRSLPLNRLIERRLQDQDCFLYASVNKGLRLIGVVPVDECYATRARGMRLHLWFGAALLAVMLLTEYFLLRRYVLQDIAELNRVVKRIAMGSFDTKVPESSSPEFRQLTMNINTMLDSLRSHDDRVSEQYQKDTRLARTIKESVLNSPSRLCANRSDFSVVAALGQADTVGGDFYDCRMADDSHLLFAIGSVNEQGVSAALHMMYELAQLRSCSYEMSSPMEIARSINLRMCSEDGLPVQVSMFIGELDIPTGTVQCVNAGMHAPLLRRPEGQFRSVELPESAPLGKNPGSNYLQGSFQMQPGDRLFLYSDGLVCIANETGEVFGEKRLYVCLNEATPTLRDIPHRVRASLRRFMGDRKRLCDYTMLCIELHDQRRSCGSISVSKHDDTAVTDLVRAKLEEVFAAPNDIELIVQATRKVLAAMPDTLSVQTKVECTERHARIALTYPGPENDILASMPQLGLDSATYHHLNNANEIILYKEIE